MKPKALKRYCVFAALFLQTGLCFPQKAKITVENTLDFDRIGEMVEVEVKRLPKNFNINNCVLRDHKNKEIPCQLSDNSRILIFSADVPAKSSTVYTIKPGKPSPFAAKTHARHVPERKDDFAWENDLAAYRMYGPALAKEYPSNGVDLWLKCTDSLIVDKFYADELERGLSYHVNRGLGLDCYSVGHTLGAGGIAPYDSKLRIGDHYNRHEVVETGCLRSVFTLIYDTLTVGGKRYRQTLTITVDAGSIMNRAVVRYEDLTGSGADSLKLAAGIVLHKKRGTVFSDNANKLIAYAENAVSDAAVPQGRNYVAVLMPASTEIFEENNHLLILAACAIDDEFVYYFGGGWSRWKFADDKDWFDAATRFAKAKQTPLKVLIR